MKNMKRLFVLGVIILSTGCSADSAKRTAYETLQNVRQRECMRNPAQDCGQRENYDDYRRKREALNEVD
jgi:hypothetical protein